MHAADANKDQTNWRESEMTVLAVHVEEAIATVRQQRIGESFGDSDIECTVTEITVLDVKQLCEVDCVSASLCIA